MTKSKQKRIAGITVDDWLGEPQPAKIIDPNKYTNQLIAFLDVLGITNLIKQLTCGKFKILSSSAMSF
jgi:hypothetical protein